jgi:hypothetical protein
MKLLILAFVSSLSLTAFAETKSKPSKTETAKPTGFDASTEQILEWKQTLADHSGGTSFKQKIQALARLAEIEGADITEFLALKQTQVEAEIKLGSSQNSRELLGLKTTLTKILNTRIENRVSEKPD